LERQDSGKHRILMIVPQADVQGGIAAVVNGYHGSRLEKDYDLRYVESYRDGSKLQKLIKALQCYRELRGILKTAPPELVHVNSSFGPSFFRKLPIIHMCRKKGIPVVNHIHGSEFDRFYTDAGALKKSLVRRSYAECAAFIVLNETAAGNIARIVPAERITTVMNYSVVHPETADPALQQERSRKKQVLILGKIDRMKGSYDLPEIAGEVRKKIPDVKFMAAGYGEIEAVKNCFDRDMLERTVCFPGWIRGEEKDRALRESALFFLPSYSEGMPMSVLDAMGYALPVVSTNVGGIPKLVQDGRNGKLCTPGDRRAMADAILFYLTDEAQREQAGRESLSIAETFGLEEHIRKIESVWEQVLRENGKTGTE
jgi:glycosyltransferase involved in cell wall biosynthesis